MNWLDVVIVATFAWLTFSALNTGVIREAINVVSGLLGVLLAGVFYDDLARDVELFTDDVLASKLVAFLMIYAAVAVAGHLAGVLLKHSAQLLTFGALDHSLGAVFGLLKAFILVEVLLIVAVTYPSLGLGDAVDGSTLAPFFIEKISVVKAIMPGEFRDAVAIFEGGGV